MRIYLGPGTYDPPALEVVPYKELPGTCPTCGNEGTPARNGHAYKAGRDFGDWVRSYITGRFADGLRDELNDPRGE
jgi:hypothetical protein